MIHFEPKATQSKENETYKVGDTFMIKGNPYILTISENVKSALLVCMIDGYRWSSVVSVNSWELITNEEFTQLVGVDYMGFVTRADFKLIQL